MSSQPAVARQARKLNADAFARDASEGIPEGRAIAIQFALDGLWLSEALRTAALTPRRRQALRDSLMALARPEASATRRPRRQPISKKGRRA